MVSYTGKVNIQFRITTLTTVTPWSKVFASMDDLIEWTKSMDIADGWIMEWGPGTSNKGERFVEIQGKREKTHKVEIEVVP